MLFSLHVTTVYQREHQIPLLSVNYAADNATLPWYQAHLSPLQLCSSNTGL